MSSPLANLEPKALWHHFDQLRQIPRPSKHEGPVREHILRWAAGRHFESVTDAVGNVIVRVPATPGHEKAPIVILQGHMDMVAEKDKATNFDFLKDAIPVEIQGDWVVAPHTTLGADNGIGIAAAMGAVDDPTVVHGPLELLCTMDEETGLTGATELDGKLLRGRVMLNLDSEDDGTLFVGCAGGATTEITFDLVRASAPADYVALRMEVSGLKGGHSGLNIHENRGNSIKIMASVLTRWFKRSDVLIDSVEGGNKHNAIPREAAAVVFVPSAFVEEAGQLADAELKKVLTEYGTIDPGLQIQVQKVETKERRPANGESSRLLVNLLVGMPHGVLAMSRDIPGLTETSTNLAIVRTEGERVDIVTSTRSSVEAALRRGLDQGNAVVSLAGARRIEVGSYPGWQPNMASPLLRTCKEVFHKLYGKEPHVTAIHAGLECGIIGEKLGGQVDMISFGPQLVGVHAPGEKVQISSVARFWDFYKEVLRHLATV